MATLQVKPLMLKEFLELDDNSDSFNGFQCIPRRPAPADESLVRSRSKGALTKITDAINNIVIKNLPISSPTSTRAKTKRSLSKKIMGRGFWSGRTVKEEVVREKDIVRFNSSDMYAADKTHLCSSCSSTCSSPRGRSSSSSPHFLLSSNASFDCPNLGEAARDSSVHSPMRMIAILADAALSGNHQKTKEKTQSVERECSTGCQSEEEKEQLSPVSVMNFPFQQEEQQEEECDSETVWPCFEQSLANIEGTRHQLLLNIRRFESLAELDPVELVETFTNFEDHVPSDDDEEDITKSTLIARLRSVGPHKKLLLDFFDEEMMWTNDMEGLLTSAQKWIVGEGQLTVGDHRNAEMKDMERNGRWRCFEDDNKEDLAVYTEVRIMGSLVEELVLDIIVLMHQT